MPLLTVLMIVSKELVVSNRKKADIVGELRQKNSGCLQRWRRQRRGVGTGTPRRRLRQDPMVLHLEHGLRLPFGHGNVLGMAI